MELLDDKKSILIEKIKNVITELIHYSDEFPKPNYSDHISETLNYDYTYLSNIFSEVKGMTIQQYIIIHKIERVKESNQFKKTQAYPHLSLNNLRKTPRQFGEHVALT